MARKLRRVSRKFVFAGAVVAGLLIIAYVAVIPTVVANYYFGELESHTAELRPRLKNLTTGAGVKIFSDPDITLPERQALLSGAVDDVEAARKTLDGLEKSNSLSRLPGNGFAGDYHKALVRQERTDNMIRQTRQVLDRYAGLLGYIGSLTSLQMNLESRLDKVNQVSDFNRLVGAGNNNIASEAVRTKNDRQAFAALSPPADFAQLHVEALASFDQAASGLDQLARGLASGSDAQIYGAVKSLEEVTNKSQVADRDTLVNLANSSSTLRQLDELPEKADHARGR